MQPNRKQQRKGSAHRHQYAVAEKARLLDVFDQVRDATPEGEAVGEAFEADPRSRGCPYKTVQAWAYYQDGRHKAE